MSSGNLGGFSHLLAPYKALGLVCSPDVPLVLRPLPTRKIVTVLCPVDGAVVHQYNAQSLRLISVSDTITPSISGSQQQISAEIIALAADQRYVYVSFANCGQIAALHFSRQVHHVFNNADSTSPVHLILPFGEVLITIDRSNRLVIWEIDSADIYTEISYTTDDFQITTICHPATYLNKVFVGSQQGVLRLLNVKHGKLVHEFSGWKMAVSVLEQSPAVDVMAVGLRNGVIHLHNIKYDETVMSFRQDWGAVTAIAFRTDGLARMVSGGGDTGNLAIWDLEKRQLAAQMTDVHLDKIVGVKFVQNEAMMVTNGGDNCLKTWLFDDAADDETARLLAIRDGHPMEATSVKFQDSDDGEMLLSSGGDGTLRAFSTWKDTKRYSLGTAATVSKQKAKRHHLDFESLRLPPIVEIASGSAREAVWDDVVCRHRNSLTVSSWTSRRKRLGTHRFVHERFETYAKYSNATATCCDVSACGNFVAIGYSSGHVDLWNIQSGQYRGSFTDKAKEVITQGNDTAHSCGIVGLSFDALNQVFITAGVSDGRVCFWRFKTRKPMAELKLEADTLSRIVYHRQNELLAVALADQGGTLLVVDSQFRRVVRRFDHAHKGGTSDMCFDRSGAWLVSSGAEDCLVKIWDVPTATLIDVVRFVDAVTSIAMSPTLEYLASCHRGRRGVYLWVNKKLYQPTLVLKPLKVDFEPEVLALLPSSSAVAESTDENALSDGEPTNAKIVPDEEMMEELKQRPTVEQIGSLITESGLATPRWANLPDMDAIRQRNKPKEPPKKPKSAPFFLPTVSGLGGFEFDANATKADSSVVSSKVIEHKRHTIEQRSVFAKLLVDDKQKAFQLLKECGPSRIDLELRGLTEHEMVDFLQMIVLVAEERKDFELVQSYLATFLKIHREYLLTTDDSCLAEVLKRTANLQKETWARIDQLLLDTQAVVQWLKSAVL